jgi:hypothetical protein
MEGTAWTVFGLPLRINRITVQRIFVMFLFYTFCNYVEYRLHAALLAIVTLVAVRQQR